MKKPILLATAALVAAIAAQAQVTIDWIGATDGLWSTTTNWGGGNIPDSNTELARFNLTTNVDINIDGDYTINRYTDGGLGVGNTNSLYGAGTLRIDVNSSFGLGIENATNNAAGSTLRVGSGNIRIFNSVTGTTSIRNLNSTGNIILFDTTSTLRLSTSLQTVQGVGGSIRFNGTLAASEADLQINSNNVSFNTGHNSTAFGRDIVLLGNSKLAVNGGSVLNTGRKFQVNGTGAELELNGANAVNGANIVVGGSNTLLLDVNANQSTMGDIRFADNGILTIDLAPSVTELFFADSSAQNWINGTIAITGFQEGVIKFGTDATGLTEAQLAAISAIGVDQFYITNTGYLTAVPEPSTFALIAGSLALALILIRRRRA